MTTPPDDNLHEFIDHMPVAVYRSTPSGDLILANQALCDLLGYESPSDLLDVNVKSLYADPERRERLLARLIDGEDVAPHEISLRRRDGGTVWVRVAARAIEDDRGEIQYMEGVLEDVTERHLAEAALEVSEALFESAFDDAPQGLAIIGTDLRLQRVNRAMCAMLGMSEPDLIGISALDIQHPDETVHARANAAHLLAGTADAIQVERRLRHAGGHWVPVLLASSSVRGQDGEVVAVVSQIFDITGRKEIEARLIESEARFRSAFDDAPVGMVIGDRTMMPIQVNPTLCRLLEMSEEEVLKTSLAGMWSPEDREDAESRFAAMMDGTLDSYQAERTVVLASGKVVRALVNVSPVRDQSGELRFVLGQIMDMTERLEAEAALRAKQAENQALLNSIPDMMFRLDRDGVFRWVRPSPDFPPLKPVEELLDRRISDLFPGVGDRLAKTFAQVIDSGEAAHLDFARDYGDITRQHEASVIKVEEDQVLVIVRDISERKAVEQRLLDLVRSKDDLVASVSHELRTPLTTIVGLASELKQRDGDFRPDERAELIHLIDNQATEMADLIDDLLVAARAEVGMVTVAAQSIDLLGEVHGTLSAWGGGVASVTVPDDEVKVWADPFRVRQILRNLLSNAERYGAEPVSLTIEVHRNALLLLEDGGAPLPEDQWEAIFDPYHRAHERAGVPASVGLGLTVSRHLARLMGGDLHYKNRNGRSTFALELPLANGAPRGN